MVLLKQYEQDREPLSALSLDFLCPAGLSLCSCLKHSNTTPGIYLCSWPRPSLPSKGIFLARWQGWTQDCNTQCWSCESWICYGNFTIYWGPTSCTPTPHGEQVSSIMPTPCSKPGPQHSMLLNVPDEGKQIDGEALQRGQNLLSLYPFSSILWKSSTRP